MRAIRRRLILTWVPGMAAIALSGWWAIATPEVQHIDMTPAIAQPQDLTPPDYNSDRPEFDVDSLVVQLWNPPPPPVDEQPEEAVTQAVPPLRLQLIGIIAEGDGYKAALYDPEGDRIHIVTDGHTIGSIEVESVTANLVNLADGERTQSLELITGREGPPS